MWAWALLLAALLGFFHRAASDTTITVLAAVDSPMMVYTTSSNAADSKHPSWELGGPTTPCTEGSRITHHMGDYFTFTFVGTGVAVYGTKGPKGGLFDITFDAQSAGQFDRYKVSPIFCNQTYFQQAGLPNGTHVLTMQMNNPSPAALATDIPILEPLYLTYDILDTAATTASDSPTATVSDTTNSNTASSSGSSQHGGSSHSSAAAIGGGVAGGIVALASLLCVGLWWYSVKKRRSRENATENHPGDDMTQYMGREYNATAWEAPKSSHDPPPVQTNRAELLKRDELLGFSSGQSPGANEDAEISSAGPSNDSRRTSAVPDPELVETIAARVVSMMREGAASPPPRPSAPGTPAPPSYFSHLQ